MAWPPPTLNTNRTNATPQLDNHPADHNTLADFANEAVTRIDAATAANTWTTPAGTPTGGFFGQYAPPYETEVLTFSVRRTTTMLVFYIAVGFVSIGSGSISVPSSGNITNADVAQLPAAWGNPIVTPWPLTSGAGGRTASASLTAGRMLSIASVAGSTPITPGEGFSFGGVVPLS